MLRAAFQVLGIEFPTEVRAAAVGEFVECIVLIDVSNEPSILQHPDPFPDGRIRIVDVRGDYPRRGEKWMARVIQKELKNGIVGPLHPLYTRPSHSPNRTNDSLLYKYETVLIMHNIMLYQEQNCSLVLSSRALTVQSNDCSRPGSTLRMPKRTPKGPGGRWDDPTMRRHNDRTKPYDADGSKATGARRIDARRRGPEGFEWLPPVATATADGEETTLELAGRGPREDTITATDPVEVTR